LSYSRAAVGLVVIYREIITQQPRYPGGGRGLSAVSSEFCPAFEGSLRVGQDLPKANALLLEQCRVKHLQRFSAMAFFAASQRDCMTLLTLGSVPRHETVNFITPSGQRTAFPADQD